MKSLTFHLRQIQIFEWRREKTGHEEQEEQCGIRTEVALIKSKNEFIPSFRQKEHGGKDKKKKTYKGKTVKEKKRDAAAMGLNVPSYHTENSWRGHAEPH